MKNKFYFYLFPCILFAHQPVMDMAPRWSGGYGFQIRYESFGSDKTILDKDLSSTYYQETYWLEGVYTWHRSRRITFKIPYNSVENSTDDIVSSHHSVGDLILALPLKKYSNFKRSTQNFGFTPQIRIPFGEQKTHLDGLYGAGVSLSYSAESFRYYQMYDLYAWTYNDRDPMMGLDVNLGIHPIHNNATNTGLFIMWDLTSKWDEASTVIQTGPVLVPYKHKIMARFEVKFPIVENGNDTQLSKGIFINTGIGFIF